MPPIIVPSVGVAGPNDVPYLVDRLADELGMLQSVTTSTVATGADPSRVVLSEDLRDDEMGYEWGGQWAYVTSGTQAGAQRRIISQLQSIGYQGQRSAVMLSRPLVSPLATSVAIKVTSPLPVVRCNGVKGLREILSEGLNRIRVAGRIAFTGNGLSEYDLTTLYPWLTDDKQLVGVYDTRWASSTAAPSLTGYRPRIVSDGVTRTLVLDDYAYSTSETWYLDVIVPADRLLYDGAAWGYQTTPGLLSDEYAVAAPEDQVLAFGMVQALEYLMRRAEEDERITDAMRGRRLASIDRRKQKWVVSAADLKLLGFPRPLMERPGPTAIVVGAGRRWNR